MLVRKLKKIALLEIQRSFRLILHHSSQKKIWEMEAKFKQSQLEYDAIKSELTDTYRDFSHGYKVYGEFKNFHLLRI